MPASIPAETQRVALKQVFAAEFYTPAHAARLFGAFEKLGWSSPDTSPFRMDAAERVTRSRRRFDAMWLNLGTIVPPGTKRVFRDATVCDLPKGFVAAHANFFSISPSLSCIVVAFDANTETEERFDNIARSPLGTKLTRIKRGFSIARPRNVKQQAIGDARQSNRNDILSWFKTYLPGAFSTSESLELLPTCELMFTDGLRACDDRTSNGLWREYLGLDYGLGGWDSSDMNGLTFVHPVSSQDRDQGHSLLYIERSALKRIENSTYGGDSDQAYINRLSTDLPGFIGYWGIGALLRLYQEEISVVRDAGSSSVQSGDASGAVKRLQRVTSNSIDISLLASELPDALRNVHWTGCDFFRKSGDEPPTSLVAASSQWSTELLERLGTSDRAIRDLLVQQGNLINSLEAIASQRTMSRLTFAMTLLTVAIFILTAVMAVPVVYP
ncbi:hypothetical protein SAMN05880561_103545 [Rhizobium sp. RU33A]|nr:hypothetical protein SAMN05880561_103545 [Rhizobium sp. RU33A]